MFQKLGQQSNVKYAENDWDWSESNLNKDNKSENKTHLTAVQSGPEGIRSD